MPKLRDGAVYRKDSAPPIDWLLAAVLERKLVLGYDAKRLADIAGVSYETMCRNLRISPWRWSPRTRTRVCQTLGIRLKQTVEGAPEGGETA